jgi:hypothetical protein
VFYSSNIIWQNSCDLSKKSVLFHIYFSTPTLANAFQIFMISVFLMFHIIHLGF